MKFNSVTQKAKLVNKTRVVFLGSRPLGKFALDILKNLKNVELIACVVKEPGSNAWWDQDPFYDINCTVISHEQLSEIDFDLGVSINYWKIIPAEIISRPTLGFVNLHHAYNLSLRGRNMATRAILQARSENMWFHGTTLHYTDDGLDTGPIIAAESCEISEIDTAWTLFLKVESLGQKILAQWLPRLAMSRIPAASPIETHPLSMKFQENAKYIANIYEDLEFSYDTVRAFDFNGYFPGATTKINGEMYELTSDERFAESELLKIDEKRKIYLRSGQS